MKSQFATALVFASPVKESSIDRKKTDNAFGSTDPHEDGLQQHRCGCQDWDLGCGVTTFPFCARTLRWTPTAPVSGILAELPQSKANILSRPVMAASHGNFALED